MAEFRTNPGDSSVTELEREVDRERERVSATIDELQARASVGSLVDQVVKAVERTAVRSAAISVGRCGTTRWRHC